MRVVLDRNFERSLERLPVEIQRLAHRQIQLLGRGLIDPRLHVKKLKGHEAWSFRITSRYRGLFYKDDNELVLFEVGHRRDIYQ